MSSENGEQKPTIPIKSSMEILSELFSTFHAEPPLIIKKEKSEDAIRKHKKSKKKHKHKDKKHKKKEKKRKKSSSSSSDSEVDLAKILIKQEKEASEKKIKIEGTELALHIKTNSKPKDVKKENILDVGSEDSDKAVGNKIKIKSLKLNSIFESTIKEIQNQAKRKVDEDGEISDSESSISDKELKKGKRCKHKLSSEKHSRSSSRDKSEKKVKTDDLRHKIKSDHKYKEKPQDKNRSKEKDRSKDYGEKDFYKGSGHSRSNNNRHSRDRARDRQREHRSRSRERHNDPYNREIEDYKRHRNRGDSFYKDDGFYKSRDRDEKWHVRDR